MAYGPCTHESKYGPNGGGTVLSTTVYKTMNLDEYAAVYWVVVARHWLCLVEIPSWPKVTPVTNMKHHDS